MPIEMLEPPRLSIEALESVLPSLVGNAGILHRAPRFAATLLASPRSLSHPTLSYPVYALGLDHIAAGASLSKAKLVAWRHEFTSGDEVVAAEVSAGRKPHFAGLNVNSNFRSVQKELRSAVETGKGFADRTYQPRLLQVSALGTRALWLKSTSRTHADLLIPLSPAQFGLTAHRHYSSSEFIEAIRPAAEIILRTDASGKGT